MKLHFLRWPLTLKSTLGSVQFYSSQMTLVLETRLGNFGIVWRNHRHLYSDGVYRSCREVDIHFGRRFLWVFGGPALLFNRGAFGHLRFVLLPPRDSASVV